MTNCPKIHIVNPRFGYLAPGKAEKIRVILNKPEGFEDKPCRIRLLLRVAGVDESQTHRDVAQYWKKAKSFEEYKIRCRWKRKKVFKSNSLTFGVVGEVVQMPLSDLISSGPTTRVVDLMPVICRVLSSMSSWELNVRDELLQTFQDRFGSKACMMQLMSSFGEIDLLKKGLLKYQKSDGFLFFRQIRQMIENRLIEYNEPMDVPKNLKVWNPFHTHDTFPPIASLVFLKPVGIQNVKYLCKLKHRDFNDRSFLLITSRDLSQQMSFEPLLQLFNMIWFNQGLEFNASPISIHWLPILPLARGLFCLEHHESCESISRFTSANANRSQLWSSLVGFAVACYVLGISCSSDLQIKLTPQGCLMTTEFSDVFTNHRFLIPSELATHFQDNTQTILDLSVLALSALRQHSESIIELAILMLQPSHQEYEIRKTISRILELEKDSSEAVVSFQNLIFNVISADVKEQLH